MKIQYPVSRTASGGMKLVKELKLSFKQKLS